MISSLIRAVMFKQLAVVRFGEQLNDESHNVSSLLCARGLEGIAYIFGACDKNIHSILRRYSVCLFSNSLTKKI